MDATSRVKKPIDDTRIDEIRSLLDTGNYDLLSLDIFDTVAWRMAPSPRDAFYLVANELRARNAIHSSSSRESFLRVRVESEERARKMTPGNEVSLSDIYGQFPRGYLKGITPSEVCEIELEVESRIVKVNPHMRDLITHAREMGLKTAFVSDTYFVEKQIRDLIGINVDYIVLSCEHKVSKYQGLHKVLIERSCVSPEKILHIGNDYMADIEGPAVFNIARYHFPIFPSRYEEMVDLELPRVYSERARYFPTDDRGLTSLRGQRMFQAKSEYERWGAGVLGPLVTGFCDWVIARCREAGIKSVLCLMREGRIFKGVIDRCGSGLETRELFISRYAARRAAIFDCTEEELAKFIRRPSPQKIEMILKQLGLVPGDVPDVDPEELLVPKIARRLINRITGDQELRAKVIDASARVRDGLLKHLRCVINVTGNEPVAVVDLGYNGSIQACLQQICDREGLPLRTHGLYLVSGGGVTDAQATGCIVEGWLAENGQPIGMAHTFMRSPEIVEQSLMADCGTTIGYSDDGEPVLDDFRVPQEQRSQILEIQKGLFAFSAKWVEHKSRYDVTYVDHLKRLYEAICIRFVARPLEVELDLFGGWQHDENFGSSTARCLADPVGLDQWEIEHMSAHQVASLPMARLHWPFGFAHRISRNMGEAVAAIYLRAVPPEAFDSAEEPQQMVFYWDSGGGFNQEESKVQQYVMNNRGRIWQRFSLEMGNDSNRMYGFSIGRKNDLIRLAGIAIHRTPKGEETETVRIHHGEIEKMGYEHLHEDIYLVTEDPAVLAVPTPGLDNFTGRVDVDLFFSLVQGA